MPIRKDGYCLIFILYVLCSQVVSSLAQIHTGQGNVMVKRDGHAVIVDVGMPALTNLYTGDGRIPGMCAYKPPEQLRPPDNEPLLPTEAMDTYAYATTSYAVRAFVLLYFIDVC